MSATGEIFFSTTNVYDGIDLVAEIQNGVRVERPSDAFGRPAGISIGDGYSVDYGYDDFGRFSSVSSSVSSVVNYSYLPGSDIISVYTAGPLTVTKSYESRRDLIAAVSNTWDGSLVSAFAYSNDEAGRRTRRIDATPGLSVTNAFGYNPRSEVTEAVMGDDTYGYAYDPIGNRIVTTKNTETTEYVANNLNQYAQISVPSVPSVVHPTHDADGNMTFLPSTSGGGAGGEGWYLQWNGENRLILASNAQHIVTYAYDHQGRMVSKVIDGASRSFLWDGYNTVRETINHQPSTTNHYVWGLDLSGTLQGAGGVGGLLAVTTVSSDTSYLPPLTYYPTCDANGNVTEYLATNGTVRAHYEYSAFGETTSQSGDLAETFTHRFSTKPWCGITGLSEYELRKYRPDLGSWLSRDPIGERGGVNLQHYLYNDGLNYVDILGLAPMKIKVDKCEAVLVMGHGSASNPIQWSFPSKEEDPYNCAVGGAVVCYPEKNNPESPRRWPNMPRHDDTIGTGFTAYHPGRAFGDDYNPDPIDWSDPATTTRDPAQILNNVLSEDAIKGIMDKLCEDCDAVSFRFITTKKKPSIFGDDIMKEINRKTGMKPNSEHPPISKDCCKEK